MYVTVTEKKSAVNFSTNVEEMVRYNSKEDRTSNITINFKKLYPNGISLDLYFFQVNI